MWQEIISWGGTYFIVAQNILLWLKIIFSGRKWFLWHEEVKLMNPQLSFESRYLRQNIVQGGELPQSKIFYSILPTNLLRKQSNMSPPYRILCNAQDFISFISSPQVCRSKVWFWAKHAYYIWQFSPNRFSHQAIAKPTAQSQCPQSCDQLTVSRIYQQFFCVVSHVLGHKVTYIPIILAQYVYFFFKNNPLLFIVSSNKPFMQFCFCHWKQVFVPA